MRTAWPSRKVSEQWMHRRAQPRFDWTPTLTKLLACKNTRAVEAVLAPLFSAYDTHWVPAVGR